MNLYRNSTGMVTVSTLRHGRPIELLPSAIGCHIETTRKQRQTFIITLLNSDNTLDSMTIAVTNEHELLDALIQYIQSIEYFRDGDIIAITTPPWTD